MKKTVVNNAVIYQGDCRKILDALPEKSVQMAATSPPYWSLRSYGDDKANEIGSEKTPQEFVATMVDVFRSVRRVLRDDGTLWVNLGDSYAGGGRNSQRSVDFRSKQNTNKGSMNDILSYRGIPSRNLVGIPWRVAFALQDDGWVLRQDIIWSKKNPMTESVKNRCTKAHEYVFLLTKSMAYFYDNEAIKEPVTESSKSRYEYVFNHPKGWHTDAVPISGGSRADGEKREEPNGRNKRSVWTIPSFSFPGAHFAVWPPKLCEPMILAGTSAKGCCAVCQAPYCRLTKKDRRPTRPGTNSKVNRASQHDDSPYNGQNGMVVGNRDPQRHVTETTTVGWEKTCECETDEIIPCTVLDPFAGACTTGLVATQYGRKFIGIELYAKNVEMGAARIKNRKTVREKKSDTKHRGFFGPEDLR